VRVVIAEDQALLREGLGRLFADAGHEVLASTADADELLSAAAAHRPDVVIADIRMPPTFTDEGARAASEIKRAYPEMGVLVLSQHIETTHAVSLVALGGFGYLLKDRVLDVDEFLAAAQRVAEGGSALDPHIVALSSRGTARTTLWGSSRSESARCSNSWRRALRTRGSQSGST
jgi:DNA-binding NarL/FixJ family response regulator